MSPVELKRSLRVRDGIAILIGITIGSGIFTTPSFVAGYFGSFAGIAATWVGVGVFVMIGGLIYAELGTRLPSTGGEYVYLERTFGPFVGFMFGWAQLFIIRTSPAAGLAIIAADYVGYFTPLTTTAHRTVSIAVILGLGVLNYIGLEWAKRFQNVTTVIKVAGLAAFAAVGFALLHGLPNQLGATVEPLGAGGASARIVAAVMLVIFTHTGWDRVGYVAGEMKNPREVIPRSMLAGLGIVLAIYWSVLFVYHYVLGVDGLRATTTPAADVAGLMVGGAGAAAIAALAIVSALGSINGTMLSSSRIYYSMARDRLFLHWLDYVHPRFRTPSRAVIAHVVWAIVLLVVRGSFENIVAGMVFVILIFYAMTTIALFRLRRAGAGEPDAFRMPGYPWLPAIYLAGIVALIVARVATAWQASLTDLAFVATGLPISWYWLRKRRAEGGGAGAGAEPGAGGPY